MYISFYLHFVWQPVFVSSPTGYDRHLETINALLQPKDGLGAVENEDERVDDVKATGWWANNECIYFFEFFFCSFVLQS
jgi:hypothetical protein